MNSFTAPFTGYKEIPKGPLLKNEAEHSISSPHSDSTTQYAHSVSPNLNDLTSLAQEPPCEAWNYDNSFLLQDARSYEAGIKVEADEKLSAKSKRIAKRNIAKERTKLRKDAESFFAGVDSKFLPEGYDDPNLDEKTKKKMIQMVRNRISAQNSRDRKKVFMQQLEDINAKLVEEISTLKIEKSTLMNEIARLQQSEAQLILENQTLKMNNNANDNLCSSCRRALNGDDMLQVDEHQVEDNGQVFSNLSSPILSRFSSSGRGLFTFFTFAALVCIIVVMNVNPTGEIILSGKKRVMDTRLLEVKNEVCRDSVNMVQGKGELPFKNSIVIQNMQPLKRHFDINHALTFKSHLEKTALFEADNPNSSSQTSKVIMKYEPEFQNAIVDYDYFKAPNLRKKNPPIIARSLPQIGHSTRDTTKTSTLFCPNGFEFIEPKNENIDAEQISLEDRILDLEKADFLQLFVPRQGLVRYNIHSNVSDLYDLPILNDENENSMLEIWCKIFLVRDLSSSL